MPHRSVDQPELLQHSERQPPMPKVAAGNAAVLLHYRAHDLPIEYNGINIMDIHAFVYPHLYTR